MFKRRLFIIASLLLSAGTMIGIVSASETLVADTAGNEIIVESVDEKTDAFVNSEKIMGEYEDGHTKSVKFSCKVLAIFFALFVFFAVILRITW